jgi:hypothetical protein
MTLWAWIGIGIAAYLLFSFVVVGLWVVVVLVAERLRWREPRRSRSPVGVLPSGAVPTASSRQQSREGGIDCLTLELHGETVEAMRRDGML